MKEMIITILEDGEIKVETKGFTGETCITESELMKEILGKEIERELKPTFYKKGNKVVTRHLPICG